MIENGFIFDKKNEARLFRYDTFPQREDEIITPKKPTVHLPLVTLYRPENPNPTPAKCVLFFADDSINMANILRFKQDINATRLIAISPYHQYFDCFAYVDNVIFCQYKDIGYLLPWLESPLDGFMNIDSTDIELGLHAHSFCYFSYFHAIEDKFAYQFEIFLKLQVKNYLPPIKKTFFILDIYCSENFILEYYERLSNISEQVIGIYDASVLFGINFYMSNDDYIFYTLVA